MKTRAQGCRCTECRRGFTPAVTTAGRQKTCSTKCRQGRRNKLARRRRPHDLEAARDDERDRQRRDARYGAATARVDPLHHRRGVAAGERSRATQLVVEESLQAEAVAESREGGPGGRCRGPPGWRAGLACDRGLESIIVIDDDQRQSGDRPRDGRAFSVSYPVENRTICQPGSGFELTKNGGRRPKSERSGHTGT